MHYGILGPTQAIDPGGARAALGGARLRALLGALALHPGRPVPAGTLAAEVWGEDPPADPAGALQALVARLRRALGDPGAISVTDGGYRLNAARDDVDAFRFERLAAEGAGALADADPAKAAAVLDDALALWRGPALADLPDRAAHAARWEARRHEALRTRLAAALDLGHAADALPELIALCDANPLDERLQLLRLRALRDTGGPAQALAAYEEVRTALADRLGADPGPDLRALYGDLLVPAEAPGPRPPGPRPPGADARRPARALPTSPVNTSPVPANPGSGSVPDARRPTGNLPARLTSFVGRESDITAIRADLARSRLITLLGPGGAGKTRLSLEAAEDLALTDPGAVPDGVWLAELAPVTASETATSQAVPEAVVSALGARQTVLRGAGAEELRAAAERNNDDPLVRLTEHCARRRMLLILDNCEHVVEAAARLVAALLERCPGLTVLATSREPLGVPGELLHPLGPLPRPMALRLLDERGAAARPGFGVAGDPEAAAEICRRLDGLPLAIELAAARLRMLTPRQIADRLDDRFRLLTSGMRTVLPRQQTLRAVVDWSWELLDEQERAVLRRLAVFSGGCGLAAAEAVCGPGTFDALGSLVDKSLVVAAPATDGTMRYRLLETVGEYAAERLDEAGERPDAERAHRVHYRELARVTDPLLRGAGQLAAIATFSAEYENLRTALRHAVAAGAEQDALCLVLSLCWYWQIRDLRTEARTWSGEVAALGPDPFAPPTAPLDPLYERCTDTAPPWRDDLLREARRDVHLVRLACRDLEIASWRTPEAQEQLRAVSALYRPDLPQACRNPGSLSFFALLMTGTVDEVRERIDAAVDTCRLLADRWGYRWELASALQTRANVLANRSDWAGDADRDAEESLRIFRDLGDVWGAAEALSARAESRERRGKWQAAAEDYLAAIAHARDLGALAQVAVLTVRLGNAYIEDGRAERGEALIREVLADSGQLTNEAAPGGRLFLATLLGRTGRVPEAREQLRRLQEDFGTAGFVVFDSFVKGIRAWLDIAEGHHERGIAEARAALEHARDPLSRMIAPQLTAVYLMTAALGLARARQRPRDAARLIGAAAGILPEGHCPTAVERETRDAAESAARALLGDEGYTAAYREGGGLGAEEAAALV